MVTPIGRENKFGDSVPLSRHGTWSQVQITETCRKPKPTQLFNLTGWPFIYAAPEATTLVLHTIPLVASSYRDPSRLTQMISALSRRSLYNHLHMGEAAWWCEKFSLA
jgi:hypothetical protein